jgi:site-specific recombinase XerC
LKLKEIWAIRVWLQLAEKVRDLALFNLAIDIKLRGCDLVSLRVCDISQGKSMYSRAIVMQRKTHRPVQLEITEPTRQSLAAWIDLARLASNACLFPNRATKSPHLSQRQYARIDSGWIMSIGLDPATYGTHTMCRTKSPLIYRRMKSLRAVGKSFAGIASWQALCDSRASKSTMRWKWQSRQKRQVCLQSDCASMCLVAVRPGAVAGLIEMRARSDSNRRL